jgi:hypothetical protein
MLLFLKLFYVMVEGSDTVPVIEQQQDVEIIWCGKIND